MHLPSWLELKIHARLISLSNAANHNSPPLWMQKVPAPNCVSFTYDVSVAKRRRRNICHKQ